MTNENLTMHDVEVDDQVEIIFTNGDRITGTVTSPNISSTVRIQTIFAGDTYISLHNVDSYTVKKVHDKQEPFEPEGEGEIWGYIQYQVRGFAAINKKQVHRDAKGLWHMDGKSGTWARLQFNIGQDFTFVQLVEAN